MDQLIEWVREQYEVTNIAIDQADTSEEREYFRGQKDALSKVIDALESNR